MTTVEIGGSGLVLPAGSLAPLAELPAGENSVALEGLDDSGLLRVVYPDGFVKHHQAETVAELAGKVSTLVKARYGWAAVTFVSLPASLDAGTIIITRG